MSTDRRMHCLMEGRLSAGTIRSGRFQIHLESCDVREIVDDTLEVVELAAGARFALVRA